MVQGARPGPARVAGVLLALSVAVLLAAACSLLPAGLGRPRQAAVKLAVSPLLTNAPLYVAQDEGFFAEQGLQVEFVKIAKTVDMIPPLTQGQIDVASTGLSFGTFNAIARGVILRFVADRGHQDPNGCTFNAIMARRELVESGELSSPAQLKGKRVAVNPTSNGGYTMQALLATAGLTLDDVQLVDIPDTAAAAAFEQGSIDATTAGEPQVTQLVQAGHAVAWVPAERILPNFPSGQL